MGFFNGQMEQDIDILSIFRALFAKAWLIIFAGVLAACVTLGFTKAFVDPEYTASISLYVNNTNESTTVSYISTQDINASIMLTTTYLTILESDLILDEVLETDGLELSIEQFRNMLDTGSVSNTEILKVQVTSTDPKEAALLANTLGDVASDRLPEIVVGSSVKILDSAKIPTVKSSPNYLKRTVVGGFFGGLLAVLLVVISVLLDNSVKNERDLEIWGCPILGVIPDMDIKHKKTGYGYGYGYYK